MSLEGNQTAFNFCVDSAAQDNVFHEGLQSLQTLCQLFFRLLLLIFLPSSACLLSWRARGLCVHRTEKYTDHMHRRTGPLRHKLCAGFYRHLSPVGRNARVHARKCVRINIRTYFRISVRTLYISCIISEVSIICDMTVTGETIRMDVKRMSHEACQIKCQNILYIFIDYTMRLCQTTCQSIYQTTSQTKCLCQTTCQSDFQETCWICQNMCQTTCHT